MMYLSRTLKQLVVFLLFGIAVFSCKKQKPDEDYTPGPPKETPGAYQPMFNFPAGSVCGTALTSNLKIHDGTDIGTVTVSNDSVYLYLTYNLSGNWYMGDVHSYAGRESLVPRNEDGSPVYTQFPGRQSLNYCNLNQTFTFRVLLSTLTTDYNAQCPTNDQVYIAMRASVRQFSNGADCVAGADQPAWGAPFLINPGNANEWATALYYCKQDCTLPVFCAYSQGYFFSNPNPDASWCQNVKFGSLEINEQQGDSLWPAQNNWIKKALFQGSALQLSMNCNNNANPLPVSIASDYNRLESFLSTLTYADIQNGTFPLNTDTTGIREATGNVGRWICNNHCTTYTDSTACTGY